ncbi:MAG: glycosyltransferase [Hyphomicrobium sp.]
MSPNGVSVIICAHNSAGRIRSTIERVARCRAEFPVEIILVDNGSTDDTAVLAAQCWSATGNDCFTFSVVREPLAGLAFARRAGVRAASGDTIVFCDDDNWLREDYLLHAKRIMADPSVGAAGGCATPTNPERLPAWFYTFSWGFAVGVPFEAIERIPEPPNTECAVEALWGAGLVVRRDAIALLYTLPNFPALTGRKNAALLSGEDLEISACLACAGYKLIFSHALRFQHDLAPERFELAYAKRLFANFGAGFRMLGYYHKIIDAADRPARVAMIGLARIVKHVLVWKLNRDSLLSLLAALRLSSLLTADQRRIYDTVRRIRSRAQPPSRANTESAAMERLPRAAKRRPAMISPPRVDRENSDFLSY